MSVFFQVAILWRVEKYELKYEWLESGWKMKEADLCGETLESRLHLLLSTDTIMPYKINPPLLYNEHALVINGLFFVKLIV